MLSGSPFEIRDGAGLGGSVAPLFAELSEDDGTMPGVGGIAPGFEARPLASDAESAGVAF